MYVSDWDINNVIFSKWMSVSMILGKNECFSSQGSLKADIKFLTLQNFWWNLVGICTSTPTVEDENSTCFPTFSKFCKVSMILRVVGSSKAHPRARKYPGNEKLAISLCIDCQVQSHYFRKIFSKPKKST